MRLQGLPSLILFTLVLQLFSPVSALAQYQVIHPLSGDEGSVSFSGLVRGADDRLYGTASYGGGPDGAGTLFRTTPNGVVFDVVHTFRTTAPEGGINPTGLMRGRDNHLYGTTTYGGTVNVRLDSEGNPIGDGVGDGVVYRLVWVDGANADESAYADEIEVLHTFDCSKGEGGDPWGALMEGPSGALYGMTIPSGEPDEDCASWSTVFKLNKDGSDFAVLARFDYLETGSHQFGPLAFGADGSIFGTLIDSLNPVYQYGSIFKIAPDGNVTYPKVFSGADGARPYTGVVRGIDGAMYGTTLEGGEHGVGTIFRMDEASVFTTLYSFDRGSVYWPDSPLLVGGDGKLYGATSAGGTDACGHDDEDMPYGCGGTFIFDGSGGGFVLHSLFDYATTGSGPRGALGVGADRHLYGTQTIGGEFDQGTLFGLLDIVVANRPPVPVVMASPSPAEALSSEGAIVWLSALGSSDMDFDDLTYTWDLSGATIVEEAGDHSEVAATFPVGTTSITLTVSTFTVSDGVVTRSITVPVTVTDAPPTLSAVASITVPATSSEGAIVTFTTPTANDIVDGPLPVTCRPRSGSVFTPGTTTVTCSATDSRGQEGTTSFVVTVLPVVSITVPASVTAEATSGLGATVTYSVSAVSGTGEDIVPVCDPASGTRFDIGSTTVDCTATVAGVDAIASFEVNVVDTTAPQITMDINGIEFNSQGPFGALVQYDNPLLVGLGKTPSAFDLVDGVVPVSCTPLPGLFPQGRTHVTCTAVDAAGNRSTFPFDIVVRDADDPVLHVPAPFSVPAQSGAGAIVTYTVSVTDISRPATTSFTCDRASNTLFPIGAITVTCIAKDNTWNDPDNPTRTSQRSFVVTVGDSTPPVITVPATITRQATGPNGAVVTYTASATDNIGVASFSCVPPSGATFPITSTIVVCTATDAAGNQAQKTFTVAVVDTVGPVITVPANIVVQVSTAGGAVVTYQASATDLVDGVRPVTCAPASGSTFAAGVTTVKCDAVDSRGNASTRSFTVTVVTKLPKPPKALVVVLPGVLWPANHQMMTVNAIVLATSDGGLAPIVTLQSITSSEADKGVGKGDVANDIQGAAYGTDDRVFQLRAERYGKAIGRVYTVTYKVASALNPSVFTIAKGYVWVPYDIKSKAHDWDNCNHGHGDGDNKDRDRDDRNRNDRDWD